MTTLKDWYSKGEGWRLDEINWERVLGIASFISLVGLTLSVLVCAMSIAIILTK